MTAQSQDLSFCGVSLVLRITQPSTLIWSTWGSEK